MISLKSLFKSSMIYGIGSALVRVMTFALVPLYTNAPGVDGEYGWYGHYLLIFPLIGILRALYSHGSGDSFLKVYSENDNKKRIISTYLIHIFIVTFLISGLLSCVYFLIPLQPADSLLSIILDYYFFILIIVACDTINYRIMDILRIQNYPIYYISVHLIGQLATIIFAIKYVTFGGLGLEGALRALIVGGLISFLLFVPILMKNINIKLYSYEYVKQFMNLGLRFFPATVFFLIMMQLDRFLLHYLLPNAEPIVGAYGAAAKLASIPMLLISAFNLGWQPFYLTNGKDSHAISKYEKIGTIFAIITISLSWLVSIIMPILAKVNIPKIGQVVNMQSYPMPDYIIPIIVISHVFYAFYIINMPSIYLCNKQNWSPLFRMFGAFINLVLNIILIPKFDMVGAAIATSISYALMFGFLFYKNLNWMKINLAWLDILMFSLLASISIWNLINNSYWQYPMIVLTLFLMIYLLYKHGVKQLIIIFTSNAS